MAATARPDDPYFASLGRWALEGVPLFVAWGRFSLAFKLIRLWARSKAIRSGHRPAPPVACLEIVEEMMLAVEENIEQEPGTRAEFRWKLDRIEQAVTVCLEAH